MAMISGSLLEVACIYLSRVRSLLRTLAIAEYGYMACSIPSREPSKKGTEARGIIVSLVDVFGPIKGPNDSWVGLAPYWLTAPTYSERGEQFETYQGEAEEHRCGRGGRRGWREFSCPGPGGDTDLRGRLRRRERDPAPTRYAGRRRDVSRCAVIAYESRRPTVDRIGTCKLLRVGVG
jgi:hypothetical protein